MYYVPFQLFRIKKFMLDNMTQLPNLPYFCNMKRKPMYIVVVSHFSFCANNIDFFINMYLNVLKHLIFILTRP